MVIELAKSLLESVDFEQEFTTDGVDTGRTIWVIAPNASIDSANEPFNFNAYTNANGGSGKGYNYVFEMGHGNQGGGQIDSTWGGFRDAWESHYWQTSGSRFLAERHIAAVRNPAAYIIGGQSEIRVFSAEYDQTNDIANTTLSGRTIQFMDDDPGHTGTQRQYLKIEYNSGDDRALFIDTRLQVEITTTGRDACALYLPSSASANFVTLYHNSSEVGRINEYGQMAFDASGAGSNGDANYSFYFRGASKADWVMRVDDHNGNPRVGVQADSQQTLFWGTQLILGSLQVQNAAGSTTHFTIDGSGHIRTSQSASATTSVGSLAKKIPIYDTSDVLLGYIPVYSSIT